MSTEKTLTGAETKWSLLRGGHSAQAIEQMQETYTSQPSASHAISLGVGYMWIRDYSAASEHFKHYIETSKTIGDNGYAFAGTAHWCLDEFEDAVELWQAGLNAPYAIGGGLGIYLPILLRLASILKPGAFSKEKAERLIMDKVKDPRVKIWPGPLAQYLLRQLDEEALKTSWMATLAPNQLSILPQWEWRAARYRWWSAFYKMVLQLDCGDVQLPYFRDHMRAMVDTKQPEWLEERKFTSLVWLVEFFIARHEAETNSLTDI